MSVSLLVLLLILVLDGLAGRSKLLNANLPHVLKQVFRWLFPNASSLCYISQESSLDVAQFLPLPVTLLGNRLDQEQLRCDGYVLSSSNLSASRLRRALRPHMRIAVLHPGATRLDLLDQQAMDVIELELPANGVKVRRLRSGQVIFQWGLDEVENFLDEEGFEAAEWHATEVRFAVFGCEPFIFAEQDQILGGPEISLAREMSRGLSLRFIFADKATENPWEEALRLVEQGVADMAGCSQYIANQWQRNIEFTLNQNQICQTFLVPKPRPPSSVYFLVQSFSWEAWPCLIVGAVCCGLVGKLALWRAWPAPGSSLITPMLDVVRLYSGGSLFLIPATLRSLTSRIFFIFLLYHSFLISSYYTAGLSSTLTVPRFVRQINTLQDLVDYQITFQEQSGIVASFQLINSSLFQQLAQLHRDLPRSSTSLDGFTAMTVKTLENAYVTDLEGFQPGKLRNYKALKECIANHYMGFVLQRRSPFKRRFDEVAMRIVESGLMSKWLDEEIFHKRELQGQFFTPLQRNAQYETITAGRLHGGFVLLGAGYLVGGMVLVVEVALKFEHAPRHGQVAQVSS